MGLGDVKFMGAVGLFFGLTAIVEISLLSFFVAAGISILVLIIRAIRKNNDQYIPFGPFLVISTFVVMFVGDGVVLKSFVSFCKMLSNLILGGF